MVKLLSSNAGGVGSILGREAKFPHASWPKKNKNKNTEQKQYYNKFNKDFKNVCLLNHFSQCLTLWDAMDCSLPGFSVHGNSRQEYWSGLLYTPPGNLPGSEIVPGSLKPPALAGGFFTTRATWNGPHQNLKIIIIIIKRKDSMVTHLLMKSLNSADHMAGCLSFGGGFLEK